MSTGVGDKACALSNLAATDSDDEDDPVVTDEQLEAVAALLTADAAPVELPHGQSWQGCTMPNVAHLLGCTTSGLATAAGLCWRLSCTGGPRESRC